MQKMAFDNAKGALLDGKRPPFAKQTAANIAHIRLQTPQHSATHTYVCTRKTAIFWPAAFYFTKNALTEARRKTICKQTRPVPLHFDNSHCAYKQPYMRITGAHENYVKNSLNRSPPHGFFKVSTKLAATFAPV